MDNELRLVEGHAHMAWDTVMTGLARVWTSTTPGKWWVEVRGDALPGLIPSDEVPAALALAGFRAERWSSWPIDPKEHHPSSNT